MKYDMDYDTRCFLGSISTIIILIYAGTILMAFWLDDFSTIWKILNEPWIALVAPGLMFLVVIVVVILIFYTSVILMVVWLLNMLVLWILRSLGWRWGWWLVWRWGVLVLPALPVLVLPALLWIEEIWISSHFREACKDAGEKVYRQVEVEGFYDGTYFTDAMRYLEKGGFRFMEENTNDNRILRIEKRDGQLHKEILERPTARYHVIYVGDRYGERIGRKLEKLERQAVDSQTGEILGKKVAFERRGLGGFPSVCDGFPEAPPPDEQQSTVPKPYFPLTVFKPIAEPTKAHDDMPNSGGSRD